MQSGDWYLAVAEPTGSGIDAPPDPAEIEAFAIPQGSFVKLHKGTWHAGPLFDYADHMDFFNLELADTNVTDHNTYNLERDRGISFVVDA